jgi:NifU-like protein involved in Fe-S cluster formation
VDEAVISYYRKLLKTGFENAGKIEKPSIFLETVGQGSVCGHAGDYMHIFININGNRIDDIKYMCACDPTVNVAAELLCILVKGKRLDEVQAITEDSLSQALGTRAEDFRNKARSLLEFMSNGLAQYQKRDQRE